MGRDNYGEILSADWKGEERRGEHRQVSLASAQRGPSLKIAAGNRELGHNSLSYRKHVSNIYFLHRRACTHTCTLWVSLVLPDSKVAINLQTFSTKTTSKRKWTVKTFNLTRRKLSVLFCCHQSCGFNEKHYKPGTSSSWIPEKNS